MINMKNQFGNYLIEKIRSSNLTITQYSNLVGVDRKSLSNHIYKRTMPKIRVLRRYANASGDSVGYLIDMLKDDWGYYNG